MKKPVFIALFITLIVQGYGQFGAGDMTSAEEFDAILKAPNRATRDLMDLPLSFSIKAYAPVPLNQGPNGTCVAWSSAYAARTISYAIQRNMQEADSIRKYAFSPEYIYFKIKNPIDNDCQRGSSILDAMKTMTRAGALLKTENLAECTPSIPADAEAQRAPNYRIKDFLAINRVYRKIEKNDILKIKKSITERKPVVISMQYLPTLNDVGASGIWVPTETDPASLGHAMCITGYDDNKAGGAFEVMNSWGTSWGDKGYFWLGYEQLMKYGNYAVELMDFEVGNTMLSGNIEFIKTDLSPMPVIREQIDALSRSVVFNRGGDFSRYRFSEIYRGGTRFKMKFSSNAPSYIYVFAEDDKGEFSRFFPYDSTVSAAVNSANATYYFPAEDKHARLSNTPGKENICILYSKAAIDVEDLIRHIRKTRTGIYQAVKEKLGPRLLPLSGIQYKNDQIAFKANATESAVLCLFVEMEHR